MVDSAAADQIRKRVSDKSMWVERSSERQPSIARLRYPLYSILDVLHLKSEEELQIILRSHEDSHLRHNKDRAAIAMRDRLDAALDALSLLELAYEIGIIDPKSGDAADSIPNREALGCLIESEAFYRYITVYQYFGIRFLAARIEPPWNPKKDCKHETCCAKTQSSLQRNRPVLPLAIPPQLSKLDDEIINKAVRRLAALGDSQWNAMRDTLDGFTKSSDARSLQLWLRDLTPADRASTEKRFEEFVEAATHWTLILATLLRRLELTWNKFERRDGKQELKLACPLVTRFLITQLYWVARLLRVEVSSQARVTCREISWLALLTSYWERRGNRSVTLRLHNAENLLRTALGRTCDLLQNAHEISDASALACSSGEMRPSSAKIGVGTNAMPAAAVPAASTLKTAGPRRSRRSALPFPWRAVFDRETRAIDGQRKKRNGKKEDPAKEEVPEVLPGQPYWSEVHKNGFLLRDMFGIALSGGGIRSATFGLGVLQGLQELDMLNYTDLLSTVSGGGFIGSWLVGNVKRSRHWLSKRNDWEESIRHLRKYANYLMPRSGMLSGDTWSLGALWLRNTLLIQLVAFAIILFLLACTTVGRLFFDQAASSPGASSPLPFVTYALGIGSVILLCYQFSGDPNSKYPTRRAILIFGILFSWFGAARLAARLVFISEAVIPQPMQSRSQTTLDVAVGPPWAKLFDLAGSNSVHVSGSDLQAPADCRLDHPKEDQTHLVCTSPSPSAPPAGSQPWDYRRLLFYDNFTGRWGIISLLNFAGLLVIAVLSLRQASLQRKPVPAFGTIYMARVLFSGGKKARRVSAYLFTPIKRYLGSLCIAVVSAVVIHLSLCALVYGMTHGFSGEIERGRLCAFVVLPAGVLLSYCAGLLMLIGLSGVASDETQREWWTRYTGAMLGLSVFMLTLCAVSVGGPWLLDQAIGACPRHPTAAKLLGGITWAAGIVGGLFAGKSSKTSGDNPDKSIWMEILANVGGLLFVLATLLAGAEVLHIFWTAFEDNAFDMNYARKLMHFCPSRVYETTGALALLVVLFGWRFDINIFSLNQLYRNRLVRCYLGATRTGKGLRRPQPFTGFDFDDDLKLRDLGRNYRGPYPLLNSTLNLGGDSDAALNTRHSDSFLFSPLFCGAARLGVGYAETYSPDLGTQRYADVTLGQAVSVSGAAASPNMGYNTRPLVAYLLTLFNVRLGWWLPNPSKSGTGAGMGLMGFFYLFLESFGGATDHQPLLNVSDGGHFENLGIYELVRRRCRVIIASDAECDEDLAFGSLGNLIRLCETDFGTTIDIDVSALRKGPDGFSRSHCAVGTIRYGNGSGGYLIYLKANLTSDEDTSILQYHASHPSFPHQSTANQFYTEDQFESYRRLGLHTVRTAFRGIAEKTKPLQAAQRLSDRLIATAIPSSTFVRYTERLDGIWERFRQSPGCGVFFYELTETNPAGMSVPANAYEEKCLGLELLQLMEDVFLELRLEDFWEHPDNRGWAILFMNWARSKRMRAIWLESRRTMGIRFEQFCAIKLGLPSDRPIYRLRPISQRG